jgi:hypothetical protein
MRLTTALCVLISAIAGAASAQNKPDFSGQWILVSPRDLPATAALELAISQHVEGSVTTIRVERSSGDAHPSRYRVGLRVHTERRDGSENRLLVSWNENSLVIQRGHYKRRGDSEPYTQRSEVWSLDKEGRLVISATEWAAGREAETINLTYRRRQD